jgi:hypothetical protein
MMVILVEVWWPCHAKSYENPNMSTFCIGEVLAFSFACSYMDQSPCKLNLDKHQSLDKIKKIVIASTFPRIKVRAECRL